MSALVIAAKRMERARIVGLLQDYTDEALGNGEITLAERLAIIIGNLAMAEDDDEVIVTAGPPSTEQELPEVQFNSDAEDASRLVRSMPLASVLLDERGLFPPLKRGSFPSD